MCAHDDVDLGIVLVVEGRRNRYLVRPLRKLTFIDLGGKIGLAVAVAEPARRPKDADTDLIRVGEVGVAACARRCTQLWIVKDHPPYRIGRAFTEFPRLQRHRDTALIPDPVKDRGSIHLAIRESLNRGGARLVRLGSARKAERHKNGEE